jgi:hypothetical protein
MEQNQMTTASTSKRGTWKSCAFYLLPETKKQLDHYLLRLKLDNLDNATDQSDIVNEALLLWLNSKESNDCKAAKNTPNKNEIADLVDLVVSLQDDVKKLQEWRKSQDSFYHAQIIESMNGDLIPMAELASRWGITPNTVSRRLAFLGIKPERQGNLRYITAEQLALGDDLQSHIVSGKPMELFQAISAIKGVSIAELEKRWGISRNALKARAKAIGVELQRKGPTLTVWPGDRIRDGVRLDQHCKAGGSLASFTFGATESLQRHGV